MNTKCKDYAQTFLKQFSNSSGDKAYRNDHVILIARDYLDFITFTK